MVPNVIHQINTKNIDQFHQMLFSHLRYKSVRRDYHARVRVSLETTIMISSLLKDSSGSFVRCIRTNDCENHIQDTNLIKSSNSKGIHSRI